MSQGNLSSLRPPEAGNNRAWPGDSIGLRDIALGLVLPHRGPRSP